jgi:hypothetical protein
MIDFDFKDLELEDWLPMPPDMGPPLPRFLGIYWPWYVPPEAEFKVSNLIITPTLVQIGNYVNISCLVKNIGTEPGEHTVYLGGDFMAEQTVTLAPGESKVISFEVAPTVAKTYVVTADGLVGTFVATEEAVADIRVENLQISPTEVYVGEKVTISVQATNYGNKIGTRVIKCLVS